MSRYKLRLDKRTSENYCEHRTMAAWKFGRFLSPAEVVHHINGGTSDNHPDNLLVFPSQRAHAVASLLLARSEECTALVLPRGDLAGT